MDLDNLYLIDLREGLGWPKEVGDKITVDGEGRQVLITRESEIEKLGNSGWAILFVIGLKRVVAAQGVSVLFQLQNCYFEQEPPKIF